MGTCISHHRHKRRGSIIDNYNKTKNQDLDGIVIDFDKEIIIKEELGKGALCKVNRGHWITKDMEVAIKTFHCPLLIEEERADFIRELKLTKEIIHPNVVKLLAGCATPPNVYLVVELLSLGDVANLLHSPNAVSWRLRIRIALDTAFGIEFLHSKHILHRDIKSHNLLLAAINPEEEIVCKVADLGISKLKDDGDMTIGRGTTQWMAPEIISSKDYSYPIDVYSYAITMWEIASRILPYEGLSFFKIPNEVLKGLRPPMPPEKSVPNDWNTLMCEAWNTDPEARPKMSQITKRMRQLLTNYDTGTKIIEEWQPEKEVPAKD